jgi:drug/metabolite transporter (DMT)-like permease
VEPVSLPPGPAGRRLPLLPAALFVLVWSSGYIAGPAAVHAAAPFTVLAVRFALAAVLVAAAARALRRPRPRQRATYGRLAVVGVVMNAAQFGLMYVAFDLGLPATLSSLFHAMSPVLTVVLAALLAGERITPLQGGGFVVGVLGVLLVLAPDVHRAGGPAAVAFGALSMLMLSVGTLGQRWANAHTHEAVDPLWGAAVQFAASVPPVVVLALATEGPSPVTDPWRAWTAMVFLAVVNSILGLLLLAHLVVRGGAGAAGSVFFLSPPVTAVLAWAVLGETLDGRELVGLVVTVLGVGAATRVSARAASRLPRR